MASSNATHTFNVPLGYLRGFLVLLVIAHHAALAYAQILPAAPASLDAPGLLWRAFPIFDTHRSPALAMFAGINDIFFMSLLFLLSGLFVAQSIERKGRFGFLRDRIIRLGIPFAIAAALLGPLGYFPTFAQMTGTMDVHEFWRQWTALPIWPSGPVWFIWLLLAFDAVAFLVVRCLSWLGSRTGAVRLQCGPAPVRLLPSACSTLRSCLRADVGRLHLKQLDRMGAVHVPDEPAVSLCAVFLHWRRTWRLRPRSAACSIR